MATSPSAAISGSLRRDQRDIKVPLVGSRVICAEVKVSKLCADQVERIVAQSFIRAHHASSHSAAWFHVPSANNRAIVPDAAARRRILGAKDRRRHHFRSRFIGKPLAICALYSPNQPDPQGQARTLR
jgi:hypothetical protein